MFTRLRNLRQGSRFVDDYADEFSLLLTRNEIHDNEMQLVSSFISGLRSQLQNALSQFDPATVGEAHRRAVAFEQQFKLGSSNWNSVGMRGRGHGGQVADTGAAQGGGKETSENPNTAKTQAVQTWMTKICAAQRDRTHYDAIRVVNLGINNQLVYHNRVVAC